MAQNASWDAPSCQARHKGKQDCITSYKTARQWIVRILSQTNPLQTYPLNKAFPQPQKTQSFISCLIVILDSIIRIQLKPDPSEIILTVESAMTPGQQTISAISITWCHSWCGGFTTIQFPLLSCSIPLSLHYSALFFWCEATTNLKHFNYVNCASDNSSNQHSSARSHLKTKLC